jgi:hypothetical protein
MLLNWWQTSAWVVLAVATVVATAILVVIITAAYPRRKSPGGRSGGLSVPQEDQDPT